MKAPYTIFGKTRNIPVVTYTDGKLDNPPKSKWDREMWIQREEDWYGLPNKGTVRVVERSVWLKYDTEPYKKPEPKPIPRSYRPLQIEYMTVGYILRYEKNVYDMTPMEFQTACMIYSNGYMNPNRAIDIYNALMEEAGL
jgi:hypothetical protein